MYRFSTSALRCSFVAAAAALTSLLAAAPVLALQAAAPVALTQVDARNFCLHLNNPGQQRTRIEVVQLRDDQTLFSASTSAPTYGHRFNFGGLPSGRYAVVLRTGPATQRYTVVVRNTAEAAFSAVCLPATAPAALVAPAVAVN